MAKPAYFVGIDLGTTNTVLSYAKIGKQQKEDEKFGLETFPVLQELDKGTTEKLKNLPSFILERVKEPSVLPWEDNSDFIIGEYARERYSDVPERIISSAKSWLCNTKVDRKAKILPWGASEELKKISPLEAMAMFLTHLKNAWLQEFPKNPLEDQLVTVTIPASFDAAARNMITEAAEMSGLKSITLLEEPQAAFYSWIAQSGSPWRKQTKKGDIVLVVDVGGGTTDFSLIEIGEKDGELTLERVAVGNHILLGGDNMDLTLAYLAKGKLEAKNKKVSQWQTIQLGHQARKAKEQLLSDESKKTASVVVSGRGSSVIRSALKTDISREEISELLLEGFFPECGYDDEPNDEMEIGMRELNLMYASDPAITRHLAKFLHSQNSGSKKYGYPNAVLLNGGVFSSDIFKNRLMEILNGWLKEADKEEARLLEGDDLSYAVSAGATYFGAVKEGEGLRIRGGVSQSYYLGIESALPAVPGYRPSLKAFCVAKQGTEEGTELEVPNKRFGLVVGKQAEFKFFKSNQRREDNFGDLIEDIDETFETTSSMIVELPAYEGMEPGDVIDVKLQILITEIGTLEVYCTTPDDQHKWKLEFSVREAA